MSYTYRTERLPFSTKPERSGLPKIHPRVAEDSDALCRFFGLRNISFGTASSPQEQQALTGLLYEALHDLRRLLDFPGYAIGEYGKLSISIGRGKGGRFSGSYSSSTQTINLTRRAVGAFAHEYAHFLDHARGAFAKAGGQQVPFATGGRTWGASLRILSYLPEGPQWLRLLDVIRTRRDTGAPTDFFKAARTAYLQRPTEAFARCLEGYVLERLNAIGARSDYLVLQRQKPGWLPEDTAERRWIYDALEDLLAELRAEYEQPY